MHDKPLWRPALAACALVALSLSAQAALHDADRLYESGIVVAAVREYTLLAEEGEVEAQRKLARIYERGVYSTPRQQVPADVSKALYWWEKAAATGDERALRSLAALHVIGLGVPVDYEKAADLYKRGNMDLVEDAWRASIADPVDRREMVMWVAAFRTYFARELKYPRTALRLQETGTVRVRFSPSAGTLALLRYPVTFEIPVEFRIEGY